MTKRDVIRLLDAVAGTPYARGIDEGAGRKMTHRPNRVFELVRSIFRWATERELLERLKKLYEEGRKKDPEVGWKAFGRLSTGGLRLRLR